MVPIHPAAVRRPHRDAALFCGARRRRISRSGAAPAPAVVHRGRAPWRRAPWRRAAGGNRSPVSCLAAHRPRRCAGLGLADSAGAPPDGASGTVVRQARRAGLWPWPRLVHRPAHRLRRGPRGGGWGPPRPRAAPPPPAAGAPPAPPPPPAGWTVAGNARARYGQRLAPAACHVLALPTAPALLRPAPGGVADGGGGPRRAALPRYIRDKVAHTTAERAALRAAHQDGI